MSLLRDLANDHLALRRALGHNLDEAHRLLPDFVVHLDAIGADTVTFETALVRAQRPDADPHLLSPALGTLHGYTTTRCAHWDQGLSSGVLHRV
jgi:hypothetical protein